MKKAFITGITGQDGSYLAELLLSKGYEVHGMKRRSSSWNTQRIDHLYQDVHENSRFRLHYGDLSDSSNLIRLIHDIEPDEIYNLAAQSHVKVSWDCPEYTADNDGLGALRLLEAIRINKLENKTRFYQASTSELYGLIQSPIQNEKTPFYPRSPYGVAKLYAYWIAVNYRESFNMFACNGILFNHESPRRGETFVTRKITMAATRIKMGLQDKLYLGNLSAKRDWGHAKDYVEGMWRILQADHPSDYVLATGTTTSIRDFCRMAFHELGIEIEFQGEGVNEKGIDKATGRVLIEVDPRYFRPAEVDLLLGDATKAKTELGWQPHYDLPALVKEMVAEDLKLAEKEKILQGGNFSVSGPRKDIKIYVAGHTGLVGSAIMRELQKKGYNNLVYRTFQELDLRDSEATRQFFEKEKPDWVIQAAAKVGGIVGNNTYPVEFMLENFKIQNNVIENSRRYGVKKLLFLGSSCIYPRETPQPMREEHLLSGYLEKTNEGYALAKICGIKLCNAYNREYGTNYISVMPCNMYGINDTYHPQNAHVIPMLIRRFHEAKINNLPEVTVWGTGTPRREFMYAGDCAEAIVWLMENKDAKDVGEFINIGSGKDMTIAEMAQIVKEVVGFEGKLVYDTSKPDGTMLKLMDVSRINALGWHAHTELREGIKIAYQDFLDRHIV